MRSLVKKIPGVKPLYSLVRKLRYPRPWGSINQKQRPVDVDSINQQLQKVLANQYQINLRQGKKSYEDISQAGFRCYSQFEEDGIILYVLSIIGMKTKKVVEICIGNGEECMATNLILNHGYQAFLFDGSEQNIKHANRFFKSKKDCLLGPPSIQRAWVTRDNVNDLLRNIGARGEVDLLSLDIDGNDYYIWEAINEINPRLCVFETHDVVPADFSLTIPYEEDFNWKSKVGADREFRSVSLLAMKKLSERKGYRLIGSHKAGFNVFFLRNDIAQDLFPEVSIEHVHNNYWTKARQEQIWPLIKDKPWVKV
jgi:hypothetical protein